MHSTDTRPTTPPPAYPTHPEPDTFVLQDFHLDLSRIDPACTNYKHLLHALERYLEAKKRLEALLAQTPSPPPPPALEDSKEPAAELKKEDSLFSVDAPKEGKERSVSVDAPKEGKERSVVLMETLQREREMLKKEEEEGEGFGEWVGRMQGVLEGLVREGREALLLEVDLVEGEEEGGAGNMVEGREEVEGEAEELSLTREEEEGLVLETFPKVLQDEVQTTSLPLPLPCASSLLSEPHETPAESSARVVPDDHIVPPSLTVAQWLVDIHTALLLVLFLGLYKTFNILTSKRKTSFISN
ncbi:hypothetical protein HDV05_001817 [Chytridiales sp. JEL 0842]|nr:hypothetical protein HDV05_001817 [Chytridiales sp. JEL 0842]